MNRITNEDPLTITHKATLIKGPWKMNTHGYKVVCSCGWKSKQSTYTPNASMYRWWSDHYLSKIIGTIPIIDMTQIGS